MLFWKVSSKMYWEHSHKIKLITKMYSQNVWTTFLLNTLQSWVRSSIYFFTCSYSYTSLSNCRTIPLPYYDILRSDLYRTKYHAAQPSFFGYLFSKLIFVKWRFWVGIAQHLSRENVIFWSLYIVTRRLSSSILLTGFLLFLNMLILCKNKIRRAAADVFWNMGRLLTSRRS